MLLILAKDGGTIVIGESQISTWQYLYPFVDVKKEINILDKNKILKKHTASGILKVINRCLENKNKELEQKLMEI